ncbi:MAG TPA: OsmC family protein [Egicoccus sp.]|nr:OsmC family protein [Egicoccus sp.]HSK22445.1 OsmC family protein [Egicoccus sp.]
MTVHVEDAGTRSQPIIRGKSLTAVNEATLKTVVDTGEWGTFVTDEPVAHGGTGEGPSPLQTVLGALCGCEGVTFKRAADDMGLDYEGLEFEAAYTIDIRGRQGDRSVRPHFQTIKVVAKVYTAASHGQLREVVAETEARCPVLNLVKDAGVDVTMVWQREEV